MLASAEKSPDVDIEACMARLVQLRFIENRHKLLLSTINMSRLLYVSFYLFALYTDAL